jgi:hypothetical protein
MNESRNYGYGVGNNVYQLQLVVVQQPTEEVSHRKVEAMLEEGTEDDLLLDVLARELFPSGTWIFASVIVDRTHAAYGSGMEAASTAISPLGFELDLM